MERKKLKQILLKFYSTAMTDMILRGDRKPKYEVMVKLQKTNNVPFDVWLDIKSFISNDTKESSCCTTTA